MPHNVASNLVCVMLYVSLHNENNPQRNIQPAANTSEYIMSRRMCNTIFIEVYEICFTLVYNHNTTMILVAIYNQKTTILIATGGPFY